MKGTIVVRERKDGKRYFAVWRVDGRQKWKAFRRQKDADRFVLDRPSAALPTSAGRIQCDREANNPSEIGVTAALLDYAYESCLREEIVAGATTGGASGPSVPLPPSLGLLALGAAGLGLWRLRRTSSDGSAALQGSPTGGRSHRRASVRFDHPVGPLYRSARHDSTKIGKRLKT